MPASANLKSLPRFSRPQRLLHLSPPPASGPWQARDNVYFEPILPQFPPLRSTRSIALLSDHEAPTQTIVCLIGSTKNNLPLAGPQSRRRPRSRDAAWFWNDAKTGQCSRPKIVWTRWRWARFWEKRFPRPRSRFRCKIAIGKCHVLPMRNEPPKRLKGTL